MNVIRIKQFVTPSQCGELNAWAELAVKNKWLDLGTDRGSGWTYEKRLTTRPYGDRFEYPQIVYGIFAQITEALALHNLPKSVVGEGRNGVVVSYTYAGGDVFPHTDPPEGDRHLLRCNILSQKAEGGAELYIGDEHIDVEVGELHCYLPSAIPHYVTTVQGQTPRILWMFGYQASAERFAQIKV
jgi:hypothetical protein